MSDPFDVLRDELVAAAAARTPGRRAARLRRTILLAAAVLVAAGSAAAAVVSLTSEDSAPLAGTVPTPSPTAAERTYRIELMPSLSAGQIGWCSSVTLRRAGRPLGAGSGCGPAPPADAAQIAGGVTTFTTNRALLFAIVDARVARVRLPGGRTIVPRADRTLPYGWKAAVAFVAVESGRVEPADLLWTLLDSNGTPIATTPNDRAGTNHAATATLPTRAVDPRDPPHVPCAIRARPLDGLRAVAARIVTGAPARTPDVNGRAFRACATTIYDLRGRRYRAAVLLDAADPKRVAADLPGSTPRAGAIVDAAGHLTARRAGPGWLVVEGAKATERAAVLAVLRATR